MGQLHVYRDASSHCTNVSFHTQLMARKGEYLNLLSDAEMHRKMLEIGVVTRILTGQNNFALYLHLKPTSMI